MPERMLDPESPGEDWVGNNIAVKCPLCAKVFIVSAILHRNGRDCPSCGKSRGWVKGGRKSCGQAGIKWSD